MPDIKSITISLTGGQEVYRPGDIVTGHWDLDIGSRFSIVRVRLGLDGAAYTRWSSLDYRDDDPIGHEKTTSQWITVYGKKVGESGPNTELTAGKHKFSFRFQLPSDGLPNSFEGKYGSVRYWLTMLIVRPHVLFNVKRYKGLTVLGNLDINSLLYEPRVARKTEKKVTRLGLSDLGCINMIAMTDRGGYCAGEKIGITLVAENKSQKDVGKVKASLIQEVVFKASGEQKVERFALRTISGGEMKKGEKKSWSNQLLTIGAVPPSTIARTCFIINVKYYVKVLIDIPMINGGDVVLILPITIGTVPQGHVSRPLQGATHADNIQVRDATGAITYTNCVWGVKVFENGDSSVFPNFAYTPMCAYAPNFTFVPRKKSQKTQATTPAKTQVGNSDRSVAASPGGGRGQSAAQSPPLGGKQAAIGPSNSHYVYPEPSAPPLDLPPSYEEAIGSLSNVPAEQSVEVSEPEPETDDVESAVVQVGMNRSAILLITFPDNCLQQIRDSLTSNIQCLSSSGGQVIALSAQVLASGGTWPARTAVCVITFESKTQAKSWYSVYEDLARSNDIQIADAFICPNKQDIQLGKNFFSILLTKAIRERKGAEYEEFQKMARQQITPLKLKHGGVTLCGSFNIEHLTGSLAAGKMAVLSQYQQMSEYYAYVKDLQSDELKHYLVLSKMFYETQERGLFLSEDLAFLEDKLSPNVTDEHES